jgi:hypothetical protein
MANVTFSAKLLGWKQFADEAKKVERAEKGMGTAGKQAGEKASLGAKGWAAFSTGARRSEKDGKRAKLTLTGLASTLGGLGAAYVGFEGIKSAIDTTGSLADETLKLSRATGMSVQTASQWVAVAKVHDIAGSGLTRTFGMLSKNIAAADRQEAAYAQGAKKRSARLGLSLGGVGFGKGSEIRRQQILARAQLSSQAAQTKGAGLQAAAFGKLGITHRDLIAADKDLGPLMVKLSEGFNRLRGGAERNALANQIFGKSYTQILPLFREGNESLQTNLRWAKKYGVAFGGETPKEMKKFLVAQDEAKYATLGLQVALGTKLAPALTRLLQWWPKVVSGIREGRGVWGPFKAIVGGTATALGTVVGWFSKSKTASWVLAGALTALGVAWGVEKVIKFTRALRSLWFAQKLVAGTSWLTMTSTDATYAAILGGNIGRIMGGAAGVALAAGIIAEAPKIWEKIGDELGFGSSFHHEAKRGWKDLIPGMEENAGPSQSQEQRNLREGNRMRYYLGHPSKLTPGVIHSMNPVQRQALRNTLGHKAPPGLFAGGILRSAGRVLVGEKGPELLDLAPPARVDPLRRGSAEPKVISQIIKVILGEHEVGEAVTRFHLNDEARA